MKASDFDTIPLCSHHHTGDEGIHIMGVLTFQERFNLDIRAAIAKLQARFIMENN